VFGVLVAATGSLTIGSALLPPLHDRIRLIELYFPLGDLQLASVLAVQAGLLLLFMARQLARGKRRAWQLSIALLAASAILHVVKGLDVEEAAISATLAVTLFVYRSRFRAASDAPSFARLLRSLPFLIAVPFAYGVTGLALRSSDLADGFTWSAALSEVAYRIVWMSGPIVYTHRFFGGWFPFSISVVALVVAIYILFLTFRPVVGMALHRTAADETDLRRLALADKGTLAYFLLRDDKQVFFNQERTAALGYRQVGGVALVSGDPVGDQAAWPRLVALFADHAHINGWSLSGIGLSETAGSAFAGVGCRLVYLGDEAIIEPSSFSLEGRAIRKVRWACARMEREGYTVEWHRSGDLGPDLRRALLHVSSAWKDGAEERGFSMSLGRLFDPRDGDCLVAVARDREEAVRAFLHFVPAGPHGYSLDVMRRDHDTPPGINEWLIARTLEQTASMGVREVSLNFAFMRAVIRP
jgi:lysyl-tRNA synthetase class 2